jgi:hypothetical protein
MIKLDQQLKLYGVRPTWPHYRVAWEGIGELGKLIDIEQIKKYAEEQITAAEPESLESIAMIATSNDDQLISKELNALAPYVSEEAAKTILALAVIEMLNSLPVDPVDGLLLMRDFWSQFRDVNIGDIPFSYSQVNNSVDPKAYFTTDTVEKMKIMQLNWAMEILKTA